MADKIFLDTNVLIYAFSTDASRQRIALQLLQNRPYLSTQVLTECSNVCLKKLNFSPETVREFLAHLEQSAEIVTLTPATLQHALEIHERYRYSLYDSLILSAALEAGCTTLFSEDLQHQQPLGTLTIRNPFKEVPAAEVTA